MKELKIEWSHEWALHDTRGNAEEVDTQFILPVVRLEDVEAVLAEAVWAMEALQNSVRNYWSDALATDESALCVDEAVEKDARYQRAQAFLASPVVKAWHERQEETS